MSIIEPRIDRWAVFFGEPDGFYGCLTGEYAGIRKKWYTIKTLMRTGYYPLDGKPVAHTKFIVYDDSDEFHEVRDIDIDNFIGICSGFGDPSTEIELFITRMSESKA